MVKAIKVIFVFLSVLLICSLCFACVKVALSGRDDEPPVSSSEAPSSEEESTVLSEEPSAENAESAESFDISEDDGSADISEDESSEDISALPPVEMGEPITPPPASIAASEYDEYFNGSLFVGHSVMVHFKNHVSNWRARNSGMLGNALLCCTSSFSFYNNLNQSVSQPDNVLPRYQGQAYKIEDLPAATGRNTVYIGLMGLNDLGMVGNGNTCARLVADEVIECIGKIKAGSPDTEIVILAATYLTRNRSYANLNNRNMSLLNNYVLEYCNENGIDFVDVATPLIDGDGYLASVYCSDDYCHLTEKAYFVWMNVLRDYAKRKTEGNWQNPQSIPLFGE